MNAFSFPNIEFAGSDILRKLHDRNCPLFAITVGTVGLAILYTGLMQLDGRMLAGRNVWTKPWKFAVSIAIFTATIGWMLPSLSLTDRVERLATYTISTAMVVEITLISVQAARGVPSHFNDSAPLDTAVFAVMGLAITMSTLVVAYVLWRVVRDPPALSPAYLRGIQLGLFIFVVASFEGWLMIGHGSHSVGVPSDSPGLPLLNWSITGGDLRIAHFIGLHALQVLPLTGYVFARWERVSSRGALTALSIVATVYGALTVGTFVIAMLGHPLVSSLPDPLTAIVAAGLQ